MTELQLLPSLVLFFSGTVVGVLLILAFNKLKTGSVSANSVKKEKDAYQAEVEVHFEETSKKFKMMAEQYQDLYQHLSVGATTLCRPDKMITGLQDQSALLKIDGEKKEVENSATTNPEDVKSEATDVTQASTDPQSKPAEDPSAKRQGGKTSPDVANGSTESVSNKAKATLDPQKTAAGDVDKASTKPKKTDSKK